MSKTSYKDEVTIICACNTGIFKYCGAEYFAIPSEKMPGTDKDIYDVFLKMPWEEHFEYVYSSNVLRVDDIAENIMKKYKKVGKQNGYSI